FTNDGTIETVNAGTKLTFNSDALTNKIAALNGTVLVDASTTLELKSSSIDQGNVTNHGLLEATSGSSTLSNLAGGTGTGTFTNDGELLVTATSSLLLKNDTLNDFVGTAGSTIQVDGAGDGTGNGSTLELQTTVIDGGTFGALKIAGLLETDNSTSN